MLQLYRAGLVVLGWAVQHSSSALLTADWWPVPRGLRSTPHYTSTPHSVTVTSQPRPSCPPLGLSQPQECRDATVSDLKTSVFFLTTSEVARAPAVMWRGVVLQTSQ